MRALRSLWLVSLALACVERRASEAGEEGEAASASDSESGASEGAPEDLPKPEPEPEPEPCEPGGDTRVSIYTQGFMWGDDELEFDLACTFAGAFAEGMYRLYELEGCESLIGDAASPSALTLAVHAKPEVVPILDAGTVVRLRYRSSGFYYHSFIMTAQPGGLLVLAGTDSAELGLVPETFEISDEDRGCAPVPASCATAYERRLWFTFNDESIALVAGESAEIGDPVTYQIIVSTARELEAYPECYDVPGRWFSYLIALLPEG